MTDRRRWDTDARGAGVADAASHAGSVSRLLATLTEPDWVAEDPEIHLIPHLAEAARALGLELTVTDASAANLEVRVSAPATMSPREARAAVHGLVGSIAEGSTHVREVESGRTYEVVTGMLDGDGPPAMPFAAHGHVLRIVVGSRASQADAAAPEAPADRG